MDRDACTRGVEVGTSYSHLVFVNMRQAFLGGQAIKEKYDGHEPPARYSGLKRYLRCTWTKRSTITATLQDYE